MSGRWQPNPVSEQGVRAVRRRLLQAITTDVVPRGGVTPPPTAGGVELLGEVLEMRRELDEALRARDAEKVRELRERARRLLAEEAL